MWFGVSDDYPFETNFLANQSGGDDPNALLADRDNAAEEVRAVATKIINLEQALESQQVHEQSQRSQLQQKMSTMLEQISDKVDGHNSQSQIDELNNAIDQLLARIADLEHQNNSTPDYAAYIQPHHDSQDFVWHDSDGVSDTASFDDTVVSVDYLNLETDIVATASDISTIENAVQAHYTIPPTTTLLDATAMTALIGRIPVNGQIHDPWRFKVIVGAANLAANGHRIPQLAGMLWAGTARGDFALSCVSGNVDTATFIFQDGSIQTIQLKADPSGTSRGLGWISDQFGNPCITGELKSNALQYLTQSTLVNTAEATADALSTAQTESRFDPATGQTATAVTGDLNQFVAGYATRESLSEISQWLRDRELTSFDAIYIPAGKRVAIHIEEAILIDHNPSGRRIRYVSNNTAKFASIQGGLD